MRFESKPRNVNIDNLNVNKPSPSFRKVGALLSANCRNVQSLNNEDFLTQELGQHVSEATHKGGHTSDVVISRVAGVSSLFDPSHGNKGIGMGEHVAVMFLINMEKPSHLCRKITYRKYSDI